MKDGMPLRIKKALLFLPLFLCHALLSANAGIGVQGGWNFTDAGQCADAAVTLKFSGTPFTFTAGAGLAGDFVSLEFGVDYWSKNPQLAGMLRYYFGPGMTVTFSNLVSSDFEFYAGAHVVGGLNIFIWNPLELYAQAALELGYGTVHKFTWRIPLSLGTRFWF